MTAPRPAPPEPQTLAVYLARKIFEAPHLPPGDQVQRIEFHGGNYASGLETDLGGLCEEALTSVLKDALGAYRP